MGNQPSQGLKTTSARGRPKGGSKLESLQRYQLSLPDELYKEIQEIADKEHMTLLETIRRLIKYGLLVFKLLRKPDTRLIIREGTSEREIVLV
jgi:hypothetical protein